MSTLKDFMPSSTRMALGNRPTTHANCMEVTCQRDQNGKRIPFTGIARPGKTARDLYRKERRAQK